MDFQIHRYPAQETLFAKYVDLVIVANFTQDEAEAIEDQRAWNKPCIAYLSFARGFLSSFTDSKVTFRDLIAPGILIEDVDVSYADACQQKVETKYAVEAHENLLPILTAYRRKMHREHQRQRDNFMNAARELQFSYEPRTSVIYHDQKYLPAS